MTCRCLGPQTGAGARKVLPGCYWSLVPAHSGASWMQPADRQDKRKRRPVVRWKNTQNTELEARSQHMRTNFQPQRGPRSTWVLMLLQWINSLELRRPTPFSLPVPQLGQSGSHAHMPRTCPCKLHAGRSHVHVDVATCGFRVRAEVVREGCQLVRGCLVNTFDLDRELHGEADAPRCRGTELHCGCRC